MPFPPSQREGELATHERSRPLSCAPVAAASASLWNSPALRKDMAIWASSIDIIKLDLTSLKYLSSGLGGPFI
uniref:Uncharacterized protein n=1 Tax=Oryza meridionalis TaxID=40149 RepID=A0A0E0D2T2_9ORYZ